MDERAEGASGDWMRDGLSQLLEQLDRTVACLQGVHTQCCIRMSVLPACFKAGPRRALMAQLG